MRVTRRREVLVSSHFLDPYQHLKWEMGKRSAAARRVLRTNPPQTPPGTASRLACRFASRRCPSISGPFDIKVRVVYVESCRPPAKKPEFAGSLRLCVQTTRTWRRAGAGGVRAHVGMCEKMFIFAGL